MQELNNRGMKERIKPIYELTKLSNDTYKCELIYKTLSGHKIKTLGIGIGKQASKNNAATKMNFHLNNNPKYSELLTRSNNVLKELMLPSTIRILNLQDFMLELNIEISKKNKIIIGIDFEGTEVYPPRIIQLAYKNIGCIVRPIPNKLVYDAGLGEVTFIDVKKHKRVNGVHPSKKCYESCGQYPDCVENLLENKNIIKAMCGINEYNGVNNKIENAQCIQNIAKQLFKLEYGVTNHSLTSIVTKLHNKNITFYKNKEISRSDWSKLKLSTEQIRYAIGDAWFTRWCYNQLQVKLNNSSFKHHHMKVVE